MNRTRFRKTLVVVAIAAAGLIGAAAPAMAASRSYCDREARAYANSVAPGEEVIGSAVAGGVVGALIGGVTRGSRGVGPGALIGGGVGTVAGAASHSARWNNAYREAYNECMGTPVYYDVPEVGSDAWYTECDRKYRSFRWSDGTYNPGGGRPRRVCRLP